MKILFIDLEFATSKNGYKICEFGYVLLDEKFNLLERNNLIINPNIDNSSWDWYALKHILTKTKQEYESNEKFDFYYNKIKNIINGADLVFGHSLNFDAKALNDECKRYNLPNINFNFYDVKTIFKYYKNGKELSVANILKELNIEGESNQHNAEVDAYNTMLVYKEMLKRKNCSIEQTLKQYSKSFDNSEKYVV